METTDRVQQPGRVSTTLFMALVALVAAVIAMFGESGAFSALTVVGALLGLVPWALVAGDVRVPPWAFASMGLAAATVIVLGADNPGGLFPAMLVVVWVARMSSSRWLVGATVLYAVALVSLCAIQEGSVRDTGAVYFAGGVGISWMAGTMLRRQERLTDELRLLHAASIEHAAETERTRIAREVHDVVAHSLTVVMLHLTGARRVLTTDPVRADEALARAEEVGRESLDSIRQVVALLRTPEGGGNEVPLPGIDDLATLVHRYASSGLRVDADLSLAADDVEPAAALTIYRVVQESLTNVLRHAPGSHVTVDVRADGALARVRVADGGAAPGSDPVVTGGRVGLGVRGMSERVRALGGELSAGPARDGGGWVVDATVPLRPAAVEQEDAWVTSPTTSS